MAFDITARAILDIPLDCSKKSLQGWLAGIRVKVFDFAPSSSERGEFITEAQKNLNYAAFLLRSKAKTAAFLREEAVKLADLLTTIAD